MLLAEIVAELGQRAFVGKVNMNMNCPDSYRETLEASLRHTREFVEAVLDMKVGRVMFRFNITYTDVTLLYA